MRTIYTDGACDHEGVGGWAWVDLETGEYACGWREPVTNNQMELKAVLEALREFPVGRLEIVSDSAYVINCFRERWHERWLAPRGWRSSSGKPVKNRDLWELLFELALPRSEEITWTHVRGHRGNEGNDAADLLAVGARVNRLTQGRQGPR